jgi:hypothetical protein
MEVQKQGNIMTLNELYAREQKQSNEIILVSILIFRMKYNMWIRDRGSTLNVRRRDNLRELDTDKPIILKWFLES